MKSPIVLAALALAAASLAGCGGGSSSNHNTTVTTVSGTAAAGAAIANATIVIEDRNGLTRQGLTDVNGNYSFSVTGMSAPFLIQVANGANGPLFSVATGVGTANVTPYTHLIVLEFYALQGTTPFAAYATPSLFAPPTPASIGLIDELVERTIQKWLLDEGIDPEQFDLLTTRFTANGQGFDAVLEESTVDLTTGPTAITDGTITQTSTYSIPVPNQIVVVNVVTGPSGTTTTSDQTLVPIGTSDPLTAPLTAANDQLDSLRTMVNTKGSTLADTDFVPFLTDDALQDGEDVALLSADLATQLRGVTIDDVRVSRVYAQDAPNGLLEVEFLLRERFSNETATQRMRTQFKQVTSSSPALLFGNQLPAAVSGRLVTRVDSTPTGTTQTLELEARALAPTTTVTKVTVSDDAGVFTAQDLVLEPTPVTRTIKPTSNASDDFQLVEDSFLLASGALAPPPPPPVVFTYTIEPAAGLPVPATTTSTGATTEFLTVMSPSGHLLADAQLGGTLTVSWLPPQSFAVDHVTLTGVIFDGINNLETISADERLISSTATSAHLSFPAQFSGGAAVVVAIFTLTLEGPSGESSTVVYTFSG